MVLRKIWTVTDGSLGGTTVDHRDHGCGPDGRGRALTVAAGKREEERVQVCVCIGDVGVQCAAKLESAMGMPSYMPRQL
jgi:hypothetical protein